MNTTELGKVALGVVAWLLVGAFAVFAVQNIEDTKVGFFPVLAAVLVAWAIGELVTQREAREG